jgi:hypothetical protein
MLCAMRGRRWRWLFRFSLPALAIPGPCTTFNGDSPAPPDAGADVADAGVLGYLVIDDAIAVCSLVAGCPTLPYSIGISLAVPVDSRYFGSCVQMLAGRIPPSRRGLELQRGVLQKIVGKRSCDEALAVLPVELLVDDTRCNVGNGCSNNAAIACDDGGTGQKLGTLSRCAPGLGGPTCRSFPVDASAYALCAEGPCTATHSEAHCEADSLVTCDLANDFSLGFDCTWVGLGCGTADGGGFPYTTCLAPEDDARCPGFGASGCSGDSARYCVAVSSSPAWSRFACADVGASCVGGRFVDGGGTPAICSPAPATADCSPYDPDVGTCAGTIVALCVDGQRTTYDCAKLGKRCDPGARACL